MRTGIEPPRTAVPTSVLAAALTYGSMCSVSKEPVTRVTMDNIFLILDFHYVKFIVSLCFFTFPSLFLVLSPQVVGVQKDSCCKMAAACQ